MNYASHKKYFLIFSALIIGKNFFDIPIPENIPFTEIKLPSSHASIILFIITLYFGIYTILSWLKTAKQERNYVDISVTLTIGFIALGLEIAKSLSVIGLTWQNSLTAIVILILGIVPAIAFDFIIAILFSIRPKNEATRLGLGRLPSASKAFIRANLFLLLPISILEIVILYFFHLKLPIPIDQYYKYLFLAPTLLMNFETIINLMLCLGPSKIRKNAIKRIRIFKRAMDLHEMHYQHIGIEEPKDYEGTILCELARSGDVVSMRKSLNNGVDPNEQDSRGWSPLMWAAAENKIDAVKLLIAHGSNPNLINYLGRTALMYAARYGYIQIVRLLLEAGANPNSTNELGNYPALLAAAENGHLSVVESLLKHGADITHKNNFSETALEIAMKNKHGEVAKILRKQAKNTEEQDPSLVDNMDWIKKETKMKR